MKHNGAMADAPTQTASVREERKVVTALFADLVGSTALGERLDPEEVKLVVGDAIGRIVGVVEEFGGYVKDLAGDGVLAFFGAPVSFQDDAERGVRAGLRITEEIAAYAVEVANAWGTEALDVRVGVSTGPVVVGLIGGGARVEYAAFGDAVNTAARVQSAAQPGTVLVDEETRRQVAPLFVWDEPVELEVKGKRAPVTASAVVSAQAAAAKPRGLPGVQARLVGRERELTIGADAVVALAGGTGGIVFVTGEAGIGKSRLVAELRRRFEQGESAPGLWLEGRCVSYGESLPYWPFRDLLREWLGAGRDDTELRVRVALRRALDVLFGARASEIYPYLGALLGLSLEPDARSRLAQLSPEALQYRTFEVVEELVERLAGDRPVVIALEDFHWADPTSVQLVDRLLSMTERHAVLLLVSQRNERDHPSWSLRELGAREFPHVTRDLSLEPLSGDNERELLHGLVDDGTLPRALEDELLAHAEGNPFYLEELVRSLVDSGALVREKGGWRHDHDVLVEIPPTVEKVILSRIDRLDPDAHAVLTAASVLGRRFGLALLEGVLPGKQRIEETLHVLQRVELIGPGRRWPQPEYRFRHALIQEASYRTLLTDARRDLHRRAAEWLEGNHAEHDDEVVGLLAHHWLNAEDEAKAVTYLQRAADKARQEYALDEAIGHYQELLPLLERRGESQGMAIALFKLALALHTSLRFAEANAAYARAFELWRPPPAQRATASLRVATSVLPNDADPKSAIAWPNIQLCMQLFDRLVEAWPERSIGPSLAERWEIADDGLRYVFHLREGLAWSDGTPLTAHDVEYGIKRVLDPQSPGSSVAIYFVLENGQDYYLGRSADAERIGVRALDDRTVEFRLVAPAPHFMSVMNRPDAGPQPRHAIEVHGAEWMEPEHQVVSGPFRQAGRGEGTLVLERRSDYAIARPGNVARLEFVSVALAEALEPYRRDELDAIIVRYTPHGSPTSTCR